MKKSRIKYKGFASILLVIIIASCLLVTLAMIEVSSLYAGKSIASNICAVSGRSVLSEYNRSLYKRYGLFVLKNNENFLKEKFSFYIANSFKTNKSIVHLKLHGLIINTDKYSCNKHSILLNQIRQIDSDLNSYIFNMFSHKFNQFENTKNKYEIERIICGMENDDSNETMIQAEIYAALLAMHFANLMSNLDVPDEFGNTIRDALGDNLTLQDIIIALSEEAAIYAARDVKIINRGEKVSFTNNGVTKEFDYADFLEYFLKLVFQNTKLSRMKKIMEININEIDKDAFSFESSCLGFDINATIYKQISSPFSNILKPEIVIKQEYVYQ